MTESEWNNRETDASNNLIQSKDVFELSDFITGNPDPVIDAIVHADAEFLPKLVSAIVISINMHDRTLCQELIETSIMSFAIRMKKDNSDLTWLSALIINAFEHLTVTEGNVDGKSIP